MKCTSNPCWFRKSLERTVIKIHLPVDFYRLQSQKNQRDQKENWNSWVFCPLYWILSDWPIFCTDISYALLMYLNFSAKNGHPKWTHYIFSQKMTKLITLLWILGAKIQIILNKNETFWIIFTHSVFGLFFKVIFI